MKTLRVCYAVIALFLTLCFPLQAYCQCDNNDASCYVTIEGHDVSFYGNSWSGVSIEVWQDTIMRGSFTLAENEMNRVENIAVCSGDSIRFVWRRLENHEHIRFSLYDIDGNLILYNPSYYNYSDGQVIASVGGLCPYCKHPVNLTAYKQDSSLLLSWSPGGDESAWMVYVDDSVYEVTTNSLLLSNLSPATTYSVSVRALCSDGDTSSPWQRSFTTLTVTAIDTLPFTCGFDSVDERSLWYFINGIIDHDIFFSYSDIWVIYPIPSDTTGHDWALYITDNTYSKPYHHSLNTAYPYTYAVFNLERGEYHYSFDWLANGNLSNPYYSNYLRAFLAPEWMLQINESLYFPSTGSAAGTIPLDHNAALYGVTQWQTVDDYFTIRESGQYKLVFFWHNAFDETQPPAAVDNISVNRVGCATPVDLICTDSTAESLTVRWTPIGDETQWIVTYQPSNDSIESLIVEDTEYVIPFLTPGVSYTVCVRALCGEGDTSRAVCGTFTTLPFDPEHVIPFYCDFESEAVRNMWSFKNGSRNKWVIGSAANNTPGGGQALYISADSGATNTYVNNTSTVFSYINVTLDTGFYEYGFDWRCMAVEFGLTDLNYLLAAMVPGNIQLGNIWNVAWDGTISYPTNSIPIDSNHVLNNVTEWQHRNGVFHISDSGLYRMVFYWHNSSGVIQPPAAVDNVFLVRATCLPPTILSVTTDSNSLTMNWSPNTGENSWMVKMGDSIQTVTDTFYTFHNLSPGHKHTVSVRAVCSKNMTSPWTYTEAYTDCGTAETMPYIETFDDAHWTQCWDTIDIGPDLEGWEWFAPSGSATSYNMFDQIYNEWLISPAIRLQNSSGHNMHMRVSGNPYDDGYFDHITVLVSTGNGRDVTTYTDTLFSDFISNDWVDYYADLSAYNNNTIHVAFVHDCPRAWLHIGYFAVEERPSCPPPTNLNAWVGTNSVELTWQPGGNETLWEVTSQVTGHTSQVTDHSYLFQSLQPGTSYTFSVRAICGEDDTSDYVTITRSTLVYPAVDTLPYFCNFSDSEAYNWVIIADTNHNCWYVGTVAHFGTDDSRGLYVSYDHNVTNHYCNFKNYGTQIFAYRTFNLSAGEYDCSFLWKGNGWYNENLSVYIFPVDVDIQINVNPLNNGVPPLGSVTMSERLMGHPEWQPFYKKFTIPSNGQYNLVFRWFNMYSLYYNQVGEYQPAAAVDNVCLRRTTCHINHLTATNIGAHSIEIDWSDQCASQWEVEYGPADHPWGSGNRLIVTSHPYTITGLDSLTNYDIWVRPVCGAGDSGVHQRLTVSTGFCDNTEHAAVGDLSLNNTSRIGLFSTNYHNFLLSEFIVDSTELTPGMTISGMQLYFDTAYSDSRDTSVDIYLQPIGISYFGQYNPLPSFDSVTGVHVYHGTFANFTKGWNTIAFDAEFTYNGSTNLLVMVKSCFENQCYYTFRGETNYSDNCKSVKNESSNDINIFDAGYGSTLYERPLMTLISCLQSECLRPEELHVTATDYSGATIAWNGNAENYLVAVRAADSSVWRNEVTVSGTNFTITGLHSARTYQCRVRSLCGEGEVSSWATLYFNTDTLECTAPSSLIVTSVGLDKATVDWTADEGQELWAVHVWNTTFDSIYITERHPFTIRGLAMNVNYFCNVYTICGGIGVAESEPTNTLQFTTASCPLVTGVRVLNVTATTAKVTWNHISNDYELEYGLGDFPQGSGTTVTISGQEEYTLTGLMTSRTYRVYVRAKCGQGNYGNWSFFVEFQTATVGIEEIEQSESFTIIPNPATDEVTISMPPDAKKLEIYDLHGKLYFSTATYQPINFTTPHLNNFTTITVSLTEFPVGVYFVVVYNKNGVIRGKLVKSDE